MKINKLINISYNACISGETIEKDIITRLFEINPVSEAALYLRECAYRAALLVTEGKAYLWGIMQLECLSCLANYRTRKNQEACENCIVNAADGSYTQTDMAQMYKEKGLCSIMLTSARLVEHRAWLNNIVLFRNKLDDRYKLLIDADKNLPSNFDNSHDNDSSLAQKEYKRCLENDGIEHIKSVVFEDREYTDKELAHILTDTIRNSKNTSCLILDFAECKNRNFFSNERIAQITAVFRLAAGKNRRNICVYPNIKKASISGSNAAIVHITGQTAEQTGENSAEQEIKTMFFKAGYKI